MDTAAQAFSCGDPVLANGRVSPVKNDAMMVDLIPSQSSGSSAAAVAVALLPVAGAVASGGADVGVAAVSVSDRAAEVAVPWDLLTGGRSMDLSIRDIQEKAE